MRASFMVRSVAVGTREFGRRVPVRELRDQPTNQSAPPVSPKASAIDPVQMKKSLLAIVLTFAVVGGMFLLPAMGQCDGHRGALGVDWCQSMKASKARCAASLPAPAPAVAHSRAAEPHSP
jgi:hypothetical protein